MKHSQLRHKFVEFIPEDLEEGVLYVSMEYMTVTHKCCCGCGREVSLPLSPTDWRLIYDGKTISLEPSIGSWSLPCQSHYWIRKSRVEWAPSWSSEQIHSARHHARMQKRSYYDETNTTSPEESPSDPQPEDANHSLWSRLRNWWPWSS